MKPYNIQFRTDDIDYDDYLKSLSVLRGKFPLDSTMKLRSKVYSIGMKTLLENETKAN